ncbi:hypothetical protein FQZ97_877980 [compost metagenome]
MTYTDTTSKRPLRKTFVTLKDADISTTTLVVGQTFLPLVVAQGQHLGLSIVNVDNTRRNNRPTKRHNRAPTALTTDQLVATVVLAAQKDRAVDPTSHSNRGAEKIEFILGDL